MLVVVVVVVVVVCLFLPNQRSPADVVDKEVMRRHGEELATGKIIDRQADRLAER